MKDEIKEIIRLNCEEEIDVKYFAKDDSLVDTIMDYSQLLDYITNLQEKYEEADNDRHKLFEQKEKAIEYIKQLEHSEWITFGRKILLNILNGGDEE